MSDRNQNRLTATATNGEGSRLGHTPADVRPDAGRSAPPAGPPRLLLTPREAAAALSISERKLWELTRDKAVRCVRLGRAVRYDWRDLCAFVDSLK